MQTLGGITFYWNPDRMTIPEKHKEVSVVKTYGGSAIFEWAAILQGTQVELEWEFLPNSMYKQLRGLYLQTGVNFVWNPETGGNTYNVHIDKLQGEYFVTAHHEGAYRRNIRMTLNIRSLESIVQSTTTTTSTTTTV